MLSLGTLYSAVGDHKGEFFPWRDHALGTETPCSCSLRGWSYPVTRS